MPTTSRSTSRPHSAATLYTDEFEVVYVCELIEGLGYSWRSLGPAVEPPREG